MFPSCINGVLIVGSNDLFLLVFFINMINFEFAVILLFIIYMLSIYKEAFEIIDENTSTVVVRRSNSNRLK